MPLKQWPHLKTPHFFLFQDNFAHPTVNWGPIVNDQRCGISAVRRNVAQRRIVGGDEAGFGTFPWQAYIRQEDNGVAQWNLISEIPSSSPENGKALFWWMVSCGIFGSSFHPFHPKGLLNSLLGSVINRCNLT